MKDGKLCIGIVGLGYIGQLHAEAYAQLGDKLQILGIAESNAAVREKTRQTFGVPHAFADYQELLKLEELDVVSICTPNMLHQPITLAALERGLHVLCEKPMARSVAEARTMVDAAICSDRLLMLGHNYRFEERSKLLRRWVNEGRLGELYLINCSWLRQRYTSFITPWFGNRELSGGGPLLDLGVHLLDLSLWLLDFPKVVTVSGAIFAKFGEELGQGNAFTVEDFAKAFIRLEGGATISLEASWACYTEHRDRNEMVLFGDRGGATWNPLRLFTSEGQHLLQNSIMNPHPLAWKVAIFDQMRYWIGCIEEGRQPSPGPTEGLAVVEVLEAIYQSARLQREVRLDQPETIQLDALVGAEPH
jgi:predicted dehydrogenase